MPRKQKPLPNAEGYLPIGLSASTLTELCHGTSFSADRILIFFKYLINGTRRYDNENLVDTSVYVEVHHTHLDRIFGDKQFKHYRDLLVNHGMIQYKKPHKDTKRAGSYRIAPELYISQDLFNIDYKLYTRVKITERKAVIANENYKAFRKQEMFSRLPEWAQHLAAELATIQIDTTSRKAKRILTKLRLNPRYQDPYMFDDILESIITKENEYYLICKFGHRFHTVWSSFKRELRSLLSFGDGKQLITLDIVNSQPWLTSVISKDVVKRFVPEVYNEVKHLLDKPEAADEKEYRSLCLNGAIYEKWMEVLAREIGCDWRARIIELDSLYNYSDDNLTNKEMTDRDVAKVVFFRVIFAKQLNKVSEKTGKRKPLTKNFSILNDAFRSEWPTVWNRFMLIKEIKFESNPSNKGGHSNLAMLMQRIESGIMNQVFERFLENGINKFIPIYDGTVHYTKDIELAVELLKEIIDESGLAQPKIKVKTLREAKRHRRRDRERYIILYKGDFVPKMIENNN